MTALAIEVDDLRLITEQMWTTLLDPTPLEEPHVDLPRYTIAGHVEVLGRWTGCVAVETSVDGAAAITAQMLDLPVADVALHDLEDALGELANILGGSLKACLPHQAQLSLPQVGAPSRWTTSNDPMLRLSASWQGHPIHVTVEDGAGEPVHAFEIPGNNPAA